MAPLPVLGNQDEGTPTAAPIRHHLASLRRHLFVCFLLRVLRANWLTVRLKEREMETGIPSSLSPFPLPKGSLWQAGIGCKLRVNPAEERAVRAGEGFGRRPGWQE